jgi:hypothetical protein
MQSLKILAAVVFLVFLTSRAYAEVFVCGVKITSSCEELYGDRSNYVTTGFDCENTPCFDSDLCVVGEPLVLYNAVLQGFWDYEHMDAFSATLIDPERRWWRVGFEPCYVRSVCNYECREFPGVGLFCTTMTDSFFGVKIALQEIGPCEVDPL